MAQVDRWKISLVSITENTVLGMIDYQQFVEGIPENRKEPYDADHILVEPLSTQALKQIIGQT